MKPRGFVPSLRKTRVPMYISLISLISVLSTLCSLAHNAAPATIVLQNTSINSKNSDTTRVMGSLLRRTGSNQPSLCQAKTLKAADNPASNFTANSNTLGTAVHPMVWPPLGPQVVVLPPIEGVNEDDYDDEENERLASELVSLPVPVTDVEQDYDEPVESLPTTVWQQLKQVAGRKWSKSSSQIKSKQANLRMKRQAIESSDNGTSLGAPLPAADPVEQLLTELLEPLIRTRNPLQPQQFRPQQPPQTNTNPARQLLIVNIMRQALANLPQQVANLAQLGANLVNVLTVNNPVLTNSPILRSLQQATQQQQNPSQVNQQPQTPGTMATPASGRGQTIDSRSLVVDLLAALIRRMQAAPNPQQSPNTSPSINGTSALEIEDSERSFVERLNDMTTGNIPSRPVRARVPRSTAGIHGAKKRRDKRSLAAALMLSPFSRVYTAMLVNKMLKYQSGVFSQALMSELIRKYLMPAGGQLVSSAINPAASYLGLMRQALSNFERNVRPNNQAGLPQTSQPVIQSSTSESHDTTDCNPSKPQEVTPIQQPASVNQPLLSLNDDHSTISMGLSPDTSITMPNLLGGPYSLLRAAYGFPQELTAASNQSLALLSPADATAFTQLNHHHHQHHKPVSKIPANFLEPHDWATGIGALHEESRYPWRESDTGHLYEHLLSGNEIDNTGPHKIRTMSAGSQLSSKEEDIRQAIVASLLNELEASDRKNKRPASQSADLLAEQIMNRTAALSVAHLLGDHKTDGHRSLALIKDTSDMLSGSFGQLVRSLNFVDSSASTSTSTTTTPTPVKNQPVQLVLDTDKALNMMERLLEISLKDSKRGQVPPEIAGDQTHIKNARISPQVVASLRSDGSSVNDPNRKRPPAMRASSSDPQLNRSPRKLSGELRIEAASLEDAVESERKEHWRKLEQTETSNSVNNSSTTGPQSGPGNLNNLAMALNVMNMVLLNQKLASNLSNKRARTKPVPGSVIIVAPGTGQAHRLVSGPAQTGHPTGAYGHLFVNPKFPVAMSSPTGKPHLQPPIASSTTAQPTSTKGPTTSFSPTSELEREQLTNHRVAPNQMGRLKSSASASTQQSSAGGLSNGFGYLFQPLADDQGEQGEHAARWNSVLRNLSVSSGSRLVA